MPFVKTGGIAFTLKLCLTPPLGAIMLSCVKSKALFKK